jgi:hypothetical protein
MIVESEILSNLSMDNNLYGEFECRTSISNPQAQLSITRQSNDGQKHLDIQYRTPSSYNNGINSIKFIVCLIFNLFFNNLFSIIFSYLESIFLFMVIS